MTTTSYMKVPFLSDLQQYSHESANITIIPDPLICSIPKIENIKDTSLSSLAELIRAYEIQRQHEWKMTLEYRNGYKEIVLYGFIMALCFNLNFAIGVVKYYWFQVKLDQFNEHQPRLNINGYSVVQAGVEFIPFKSVPLSPLKASEDQM